MRSPLIAYFPAKARPLGLCLIVVADEGPNVSDTFSRLAESLSARGVSTARIVSRERLADATKAEVIFARLREILHVLDFAVAHGDAFLIVADIDALPGLLALLRGYRHKRAAEATVLLLRGETYQLGGLCADVVRRLSK